MALTIPIAHDFICPWCWVGFFQAKRLQEQFGVEVEWLGYELFPDELEWPDYPAAAPVASNRPHTPTRMEFMLMIENIELPPVERPHKMRIHNAHEAVEYAKTEGKANELVEAFYRAYWEQGLEINNPVVIHEIAKPILSDLDALAAAIERRTFKDKIVGFDEPSYRLGVYNVPTFFIGEERFAEQPYQVLEKAIQGVID